MYPFGNLPNNLIAFTRVLRREYGFRIGAGEIADAARALAVVELGDERAVRDALRPVLSRTRDEAAVFDRAFTSFFFPGPPGIEQPGLPPLGGEPGAVGGQETSVDRPPAGATEAASDAGDAIAGPMRPGDAIDTRTETPRLLARATYSPLEAANASEPPELGRADAAWRDAARAFVRRLQFGLSRRWRPAPKGPRFDLRRTLRAGVQTGGEAPTVRWLRRPRRTPSVVLIIDGSRSMEMYTHAALEMASALAGATMRLEVFAFSTALERVTADVRKSAAGRPQRFHPLRGAWAGGTSIGGCLRDFLRRFGERAIGKDTIVMIVSDGLDVGEPDVLRDAMRELHRRSAGVVWLNPLLETPGYEPTAAGMRAAQPYISTFASVNRAADFGRLARSVRGRAR
jgi:uncharacterized protein with von Willebrand factor type A (vWA) domain